MRQDECFSVCILDVFFSTVQPMFSVFRLIRSFPSYFVTFTFKHYVVFSMSASQLQLTEMIALLYANICVRIACCCACQWHRMDIAMTLWPSVGCQWLRQGKYCALRNPWTVSTAWVLSPVQHWAPYPAAHVLYLKTRHSAIADKPRDAFRGQSRSPNMLPFHTIGMVSY